MPVCAAAGIVMRQLLKPLAATMARLARTIAANRLFRCVMWTPLFSSFGVSSLVRWRVRLQHWSRACLRIPRLTRPANGTRLKHAADRRRALSLLYSVPFNEIFALEGHAVLHGDAAAQRLDALDVAVGDCFAMIEEPMQAIEGNLAVHLFVDIQCPLDGLGVGCMQTKWPAVRGEMTDDGF